MIPDLQVVDDPVGRYALLAMIAAAAWKIWLRLKHDARADKSEAREHQARGDIVSEYDKVVDTLREEVERLAHTVARLSTELEQERRARQQAELRANQLQERLDYVERQLRKDDP